MLQVKKINGKLLLLLGAILCLSILLICNTQVAYADIQDCSANVNDVSDSNEGHIGAVRGAEQGYYFDNIEEFNVICFGGQNIDYLKNEKELTIYVHQNFNFHKSTCEIKDNRTFKFIIDEDKWLFSTDAHTMINVKNGNLILNSTSGYAYVDEPGENTAIIVDNGGQVQADNIWFREPYEKKHGPSQGGVFYFNDISKDQQFTNCKFYKSLAHYGGAVYVNSGTETNKKIVFDSCKFEGCTADVSGGAVYNNSDDKYDKHVDLEFNSTNFTSCVSGNNVMGGGGAVATYGNGELITFDNCTLDKCSSYQGGAIHNHCNPGHYVFIDTSITNCHSDMEGGAIYSRGDNEQYHFINSKIDSCSADNDGGAIFVLSLNAKISGCDPNKPAEWQSPSVISNCFTKENGGAIYTSKAWLSGNDAKIFDFKFINNSANKAGGALSVRGTNNRIDKCYFENNHANYANTAELLYCLEQGPFSNQIACKDSKSFNYGDELGEEAEFDVKYFTPIEIK